jgi:hypothetical protein
VYSPCEVNLQIMPLNVDAEDVRKIKVTQQPQKVHKFKHQTVRHVVCLECPDKKKHGENEIATNRMDTHIRQEGCAKSGASQMAQTINCPSHGLTDSPGATAYRCGHLWDGWIAEAEALRDRVKLKLVSSAHRYAGANGDRLARIGVPLAIKRQGPIRNCRDPPWHPEGTLGGA